MLQNILFYMDIGMQVKYIINNILTFKKYIANTETFDFVSNERPSVGFSFILA